MELSFLFTDVEGSSRLWETEPGAMESALAQHDEIIRLAVESEGGTVVKGTGDGFMAAFPSPIDAVTAAVAAQLALQQRDFDVVEGLPVRMGIHLGESQPRAGDYFGPVVNRAARLMAIGHGGQILVSATSQAATADGLPAPIRLHSLGEHRLKDLTAPEQVFQVLHPELRAEFPPLDSLDVFSNNLPSMPQSFVGREDDIARIIETLDTARLVTLTGPGGSGKTRLGVEAAARSIDRFPWGAWLVDLAPVTDPGVVPSAIAESIGIAPQPGRSVVDTLISRLSDRGMLIVLDNCEHLIEAAAATTRDLLRACPDVRFIATSRQRLGVAGEHVLVVKPLSWPATTDLGSDELLGFETGELFAQRASEANADWHLDDAAAPHVARISAAVEGIPLAIELAAARTRVLTVAQIADRLDQQLALLGGASGGEDRHQGLRAAIDWSYELMTEGERQLFNRLSVFRGGADYDAIDATCADAIDGSVLDALDGLVSKSMIIADEGQHGMRYRLLEPLRQYAADRLADQDNQADAYQRHWSWFNQFAGEAELGVRSSEQLEWLARSEADYDNLRAALARAYEADDIEVCISIAGSLSWFMFLHSHVQDWALWLPRLLARRDDAEPRLLARLLLSASQNAWELSHMEEARAHANDALQLGENMGSDTLIAWAHTYLALIGIQGRSMEGVEGHIDAADAIFQAKGNLAGIGNVLWLRAFAGVLRVDGEEERDPEELQRLSEMARVVVEAARQGGDRNLLGHTLWIAGEASRLLGDVETAREQVAEGTRALYELGNHYCLGHNLLYAAGIAVLEDDVRKAATLLSASQSLRARLGVPGSPLETHYAERVRADIEEALDERSLEAAWEEGQRLAVATAVGLATS
jgi:predicted ATPase/class 3 adenylate cyclase